MERKKVVLIDVVLSLLVLAGLAVTQVTVQGGSSLSSLVLTSGTGGGLVTIEPTTGTGTYNFNLPTSAGSSGAPLFLGGGGTAAMTYGTVTNNNSTTRFVTGNTNFTSGT